MHTIDHKKKMMWKQNGFRGHWRRYRDMAHGLCHILPPYKDEYRTVMVNGAVYWKKIIEKEPFYKRYYVKLTVLVNHQN